jgi:hypothetical protein
MSFTSEDWDSLSPAQFEELCADILSNLGLKNIQLIGGTGDGGRDIVCTQPVELGPISVEYKWLVQCKHGQRALNKTAILDDLAKAAQHEFDMWWLMTSARVSPLAADWLASLDKASKYGFKIRYLDRTALGRAVWASIRIRAKYFPDSLRSGEPAQVEAMELMNKGRYIEAAELLKASDDDVNPRCSYLLACCFSMQAAEAPADTASTLATVAYGYLDEAAKRNYVSYSCALAGWPRTKCLFEIHRDPELDYIRRLNPKLFEKAFPLSKQTSYGGGGCFPARTSVRLPGGGTVPIGKIRAGQTVASLVGREDNRTSVVVSVAVRSVCMTMVINGVLTTTPDHVLHTAAGWRQACELSRGDILTTEHGATAVLTIERKTGQMAVYDLRLNDSRHYYCDGYLVHNKGDT